ncbi:MAG: hypothetical protein HZA52_00160 [Planctomycetes bacterium]|nr:hypothetical protein [Planctomycetota bacterium]
MNPDADVNPDENAGATVTPSVNPDATELAGFAPCTGPFEDALLRKLVDMIRASADPEFAFVRRLAVPWTVPRAPLRELRVALITTAGLHRRDDAPFRALEEPLGDPSFRTLAHLVARDELALEQGYVDPKYTAVDPEVALPMHALQELAMRGVVGEPAPRHHSFVGGVIRPLPGLLASAAELARELRADGVDAALLIPNCSICVQTAALVACELEARAIATVCVTLIPELTRVVGAPRSLAVHFPFGAPLGDPGHAELHRAVLAEALALLDSSNEAPTLATSRYAWRKSPG